MTDQTRHSFPEMLLSGENGNKDEMFLINGYAINTSRQATLKCLDGIMEHSHQCISIADYGTADGKASLSLIKELIDKIRCRMGQRQQIMVYYNDRPYNDFNLLTKVLTGAGGVTTDTNVFWTLLPRTMYEQCLPKHSVDLSFTSFAVHMLSESLCKIKDGVFLGEADDEDKACIEDQARKEWRTFVLSRGRELKPGGYLVVVTPACGENNMASCHIAGGPERLGAVVRDMFKERLITEEEYLNTNFNTHYLRTEADFREPFTQSHPEVMRLGLEMVSVRVGKHYVQHPMYDIAIKGVKDKEEYAKHVVAGIRPWLYYTIYGGLSQSRTETEKQSIIEEYFDRVYHHAYSHSDHKPYMVVSEVIIRKLHEVV